MSFKSAPDWALALGNDGRLIVLLGGLAFLAGIITAIARKEKAASILFVVGSVALLGAFACLAVLFVNNQFEYDYVWQHGDVLNDVKYKIAGVWSGQQGSFLLWACTSAIFGVLALRSTGIYRRWYLVVYSIFLGSLCGILSYETPFGLLKGVVHEGHILVPNDGAGLNASLQNYWVVIHPPTIFTGFGSLTVLFCFALSAMLTGNMIDWARLVRPWALLSVAILGLGICMGGLWAYETLGWGGFWAWDPVENASFVPWLLTVAFIHNLIVMITKNKWIASTLLLGGLPFIAFVYGTFLTRSGFLANASVHSFAEMNRSALWILLAVLLVGALGYLTVWLIKSPWLVRADSVEAKQITRESVYKLGVILISLFGLAVAIGMSVPFFMAVLNKPSKVVPEGLYHMVVVWFFIPILLLVAIGPFISWRSLRGGAFWSRIFNVFCIAIGVTGVALMAFKWPKLGMNIDPAARIDLPFNHTMSLLPWMGVLTFVCVFALVSNLWRIAELSKRANIFSWGGFVAHLGVATLMSGLLLSRGFERKEQVVTQRDEPVVALGYVLTPRLPVTPGLDQPDMENRDTKMPVDVTNPDGVKFTAMPGLYLLTDANGQMQTMRWPYIYHSFTHDVYLALGDPITTVWEQPVTMQKGETETANDIFSLKYSGIHMQGQPGQMGTRFVADLTLDESGQIYHPQPGLTMTPNGLQDELADAGPHFWVTMKSLQAGSDQVELQVYYKDPFYPMELFYKPLTSLVWTGAGILFLGGLMAAFYRRPGPSSGASDDADDSVVEREESEDNAVVPAS